MRKLLTGIIIGSMALALQAGIAEAQTARTMTRELDPVVIKGDPTKPFWGKKFENMRLYANHGGKWNAIPFQIDKVNADGDPFININTIPQEVIEETGFEEAPETEKRQKRIKEFEKKRKDFERGVKKGEFTQEKVDELARIAHFTEDMTALDYNDELVFMGRDSGDRAPKSNWPSSDGLELTLTDPLDAKKAWVYLFYYNANPPPPSETDYITYYPKEDRIVTRLSEVDFLDDKPMIVESIIGKPPGQPVIPNVLDRFKMRIRLGFYPAFCIPMYFDENNAKGLTIGYKDGPVRLIRRTIFWVTLAGIKLPFAPKTVMYFNFYENGLSSTMDMYIPFNPKYVVCPGSYFRAGLDLRKNTYGAKLFTRNNKDILIDGKMSEAEKHLIRPDQDWIAGYLPNKAALMSRLIYDPVLIRQGMELDLYFLDDATSTDKPENEEGQHLIGYEVNVQDFPAGKYYFGFQIFTAYDFEPEQVQELLNIDDRPLRVSNELSQ